MSKLVVKVEMKSKLPATIGELHSAVGVFKRDGEKLFVCDELEFSDKLKPIIDNNLSAIMTMVGDSIDKRFAPKTGKSNYSNVVEDIFIEIK